jgi:hypothetical protein|tara:strand:+ start:1557 stop:2312 length:756 start_codon:yes stop_codon:yes gene_type:complete
MPLFPAPVRNNNEFEPILKAHENQIDGFGIFVSEYGTDDLSGDGFANGDTNVRFRNNLSEGMRKPGYMAIMKDTDSAFIFKGGTWGNTSNWASINASNGLPTGGKTDTFLVKNTSADYNVSWTSNLTADAVTIKNHDKVGEAPTLLFSRMQINFPSLAGVVLGEVKSLGIPVVGRELDSSSIRFVAGGQNSNTGVQSSIEFFTSTKLGPEKAFEMGDDKTFVFTGTVAIPVAQAGAMYYNTSKDAFYFGGL